MVHLDLTGALCKVAEHSNRAEVIYACALYLCRTSFLLCFVNVIVLAPQAYAFPLPPRIYLRVF